MVNVLLYMREDLILDTQQKARHSVTHLQPRSQRNRARRLSDVCWLASLTEAVSSRFTQRHYLKNCDRELLRKRHSVRLGGARL